jgi:hypothetical protein
LLRNYLAKDNCAVTKGENFMFHVCTHSTGKHHSLKVAAFAREICDIVTMGDRGDVLGDDGAFI